MRIFSLVAVLSLVSGCLGFEQGINRADITGTVRVEPVIADEAAGLNDRPRYAQDFGALDFGFSVVEGQLDTLGIETDDEGNEIGVTGDIDYFVASTNWEAPEGQLILQFPDIAEGTVVRLELTHLIPAETEEDEDVWEVESSVDIVATAGPFEYTDTREMLVGEVYGYSLSGIEGDGPVSYGIGVSGAHPDSRNVSVGAYRSPDPSSRKPVGGAEVRPFELGEDWAWVGEYEILGIKATRTIPHPFLEVYPEEVWPSYGLTKDSEITLVDENLYQAYLFAGDWGSLTGALSAGTWYSSEPVLIEVPHEDMTVDESLVLDDFAPLVIGFEVDEVEPNDAPVDISTGMMDISDTAVFQDIGTLSGPGYVDLVHGGLTFIDDQGHWDHDVDGFAFQVPVSSAILISLEWPTATFDEDFLVADDTGETIDLGYFNYPEVSVYQPTYEPERTYFLTVIGYTGDPAATEPWTLKLEQIPQ